MMEQTRAQRRRALGWGLGLILGPVLLTLVVNSVVLALSPSLVGPAQVQAGVVVIVPGARVDADGTPSAALEDRLLCALDLYKRDTSRRILVSGDHRTLPYDEVNTMLRWLRSRGVPDDAIFTDHAGLRTLDTMFRASAVFGVQHAVICTQAFHQARSLLLARAAGLEAVGVAADRRLYLGAIHNAVREAVARVIAVGDVWLWHRGPRHLGPRIPIDGPASLSRDAAAGE